MIRLAVLTFALAAIASLTTACSGTAGSPPVAGGLPDILQGNNGSSWTTVTGVSIGAPSSANVLKGKGVVYSLAEWGQSSPYVSIATIDMNGNVAHAPAQPTCYYTNSEFGTYDMYANDIAFNNEDNFVFSNPGISFASGSQFGWVFVAPNGAESACYLVDTSTSSVTIVAKGPNDTIWGASSSDLWRFSSDGSSKQFPLPAGWTGVVSLVEGPDGNMWVQPYNTATLARINPNNGKVISTYDIPCSLPGAPLAVASDLVWGDADGCVYSVSSSGQTKSYTVYGLIPQNGPHAIAGGPDGNPWFIDRPGGSAEDIGTVDRITGESTIVALPSGASWGDALVTGPDRNIWLTDENNDVYAYAPSPLTVTPSSITLTGLGTKQKVTVAEQGTKQWTATSQNKTIATVTKTSTHSIFTVKAVSVGSTTLTVQDKVGNSVIVPVSVQ